MPERCPFSGSVGGINCRVTDALSAIRTGLQSADTLLELRKTFCCGEPSGCPAHDSIKDDGRNSPWRK